MIEETYVLFTRIPIIKSNSNKLYCNSLWAKDLKLHLDYIQNFSICCPVLYSEDIEDLEEISLFDIKRIYPLAHDRGLLSAFINILPNFVRVIKACRELQVAHSSGAGWPFPLSFYLLILKPFFRFKWIVIIESSFWMLSDNEKKTIRKFIAHYAHKYILTRCVNKADARIFTQSYYRKFFLGDEIERTLIAPASWVDDSNLVTPSFIRHKSSKRNNSELNLIYPARLEENKGVLVLFKMIEFLKNQDINAKINITIMGSGNLEQLCRGFVKSNYGKVKVNYRETVEYGGTFFNLIGGYDMVLIANLKEEQPRIVFDSFSQGVGVIASDTTGIKDITINGKNAILYKRGDAIGFAQAIMTVVENPELIDNMGYNGLMYVRGRSHKQMHINRCGFLKEIL